jgi:H+/Cl- antiporter ClcA
VILGLAAAAVGSVFLWAVERGQVFLFQDLPQAAGWDQVPIWWIACVLGAGGVVVWLAGRRSRGLAPGPLDGFHFEVDVRVVPATLLAALGTLIFGFVLGPEAPLIMLGVTIGALVTRRATPEVHRAAMFLGGAAAIGAVFGNPFVTAFMLMEFAAFGLVPAMWLVPALVALASGYLVQIGLWSIPGVGVHSLAVPGLPVYDRVEVGDLAIAVVVAVIAAAVSVLVREGAQRFAGRTQARQGIGIIIVVAITISAVMLGALADIDPSFILFSGNASMGALVAQTGVLAVVLIVLLKALAYAAALGGGMRGGPIFPATFLGVGVAIAVALALPWAGVTALVVTGIAASAAGMIKLPGTSALLAALLAVGSGAAVAPFAILGAVIGLLIRMAADRVIARAPDEQRTHPMA